MRKPKPREIHESPLPDRSGNPFRGLSDADRRAFLKALAVGSGAMAVGGVGRLAGADEIPIDFSRLDRHRSVEALPDTEPAEEQELAEDSEADSDARAEAGVGEQVVENRAMWVEPGYLILLRWRRPAADNRPVDAIPVATELARTWLATRVTSVDQVHNIDQLHPIEAELSTALAATFSPAVIEVLHLDHDCRTVCSALDPSRMYPEPSMVDGEVSAPGWE